MNMNDLVREWGHRARIAQIGHYQTAVKHERRNRWLGLVVVSLNAIVGTTVFTTLSDRVNYVWIRVAVGVVSVSAAVLAGIQTFDRSGERSETHRVAATQFSGLQREIELFLAAGDSSDEQTKTFLAAFNARYVQLVKESPTVDEKIHNQVKRRFSDEVHPILGARTKKPVLQLT